MDKSALVEAQAHVATQEPADQQVTRVVLDHQVQQGTQESLGRMGKRAPLGRLGRLVDQGQAELRVRWVTWDPKDIVVTVEKRVEKANEDPWDYLDLREQRGQWGVKEWQALMVNLVERVRQVISEGLEMEDPQEPWVALDKMDHLETRAPVDQVEQQDPRDHPDHKGLWECGEALVHLDQEELLAAREQRAS